MKKVALVLIFIVLCSLFVSGLNVGSKVGTAADFGEDMTAFKDVDLFVEKVDWGSFSSSISHVEMGDYDGDGDDDMAFSLGYSGGDEDIWYIYDENGNTLDSGGSDWDNNIWITDIAFGNIDDDEKEEFGIARYAIEEGDYRILFYEQEENSVILGLANEWGEGSYATIISLGDLNGDGRDNVAVGRARYGGFSSSGATRWFVYDYDGELLFCGGGEDGDDDGYFLDEPCNYVEDGASWSSSVYSASVDFSNFDTTSSDEILISKYSQKNSWYVYKLSKSGDLDSCLNSPVSDYGTYPVDSAFGNTGGKNVVVVALNEDEEGKSRVYIYDDDGVELGKLGSDWDEGTYPTSIAVGDYDGDDNDEIIVGVGGVTASKYPRWYVYDGYSNNFELLFSGGGDKFTFDYNLDMDGSWEEDIYTKDVAMGDYDGDGDEELLIANSDGDWFVYGHIEEVEETFTLDTSKLDVELADMVVPIFTIEPTTQLPSCSDGIDNDADGSYDYLGGCVDSATNTIAKYYDCEKDLILCNEDCKAEDIDYYYVKEDPGCTSNDDTTELNRCGDRMDNDWDFTADFTGGCDVDKDYAVDYVCGCDLDLDGWIAPTETMQKELCNGKYGCAGLPPITTHYVVDYSLDCETLQGRYLLPDPDCVSMSDDSERDAGDQEYRNIEDEMATQETGIPLMGEQTGTPVPMSRAGEMDDSLWIKFWKWFGLIA